MWFLNLSRRAFQFDIMLILRKKDFVNSKTVRIARLIIILIHILRIFLVLANIDLL